MTDAARRARELLEALVAIPSVTGAEEAVVAFVERRLVVAGLSCESIAVSPGRRNLLASFPGSPPRVVLSTHADTVPPFFAPRREAETLFARGACDAKGSLAAMVVALEDSATREAGLLLLVGEERGSDGARAANASAGAGRSEFIVGGEPTGNRFVAGSKGCVRITIETRGVAAHSSISNAAGARSAVDPLLDFLVEIRALRIPPDPVFGETTFNIGVLQGGTAPNVVAESARAEVLVRTGAPTAAVLAGMEEAARGRGEISVPYRSEKIAFRRPRGAAPADVVSFACDLPLLDRWGIPLLVGPGDIAHAHAADERVEIEAVERAVGLYRDLISGLTREGREFLEPPP
ncbi:MAG: M20/M25/M40 family metallo-hydrolase [Acidobacteria bacterium]|nr:M20/M25/M40 family metallo-hydrolase [Acidobacteriota bacterium]MCA1609896.1 M20/M25/M40 family metallo-hydrolase [Acidobacteriota bacterium]